MGKVSIFPPRTWEVLGFTQLTGSASSTSIVNIAAFDIIRITCIVTGYTCGGGIASLRFGSSTGAVDSGNNYETRHLEWAAGSNNNNTDSPTNNTSLLRLGRQTTTNGRMVTVLVMNQASSRKICQINSATEAGGAGTSPTLDLAQGIWANTSAQIVAVQMVATAQSMTAGSGFVVEGMNLT